MGRQGRLPAAEALPLSPGVVARSAGCWAHGAPRSGWTKGRRTRPLSPAEQGLLVSPPSPWSSWVLCDLLGGAIGGTTSPRGAPLLSDPKGWMAGTPFPPPQWVASSQLLVLNATHGAMPPHPNTQQVLGGVLVPLGVLPRAKEDLGPGQLPATPAAGQRGWTPCVALRWPPLPEPQPWRLWAGVARPGPCLQHGPLTSGHRAAGARRPPGPGWAHSRRCPPCRWWTKWPAPRGGRGPSSSHSKRG